MASGRGTSLRFSVEIAADQATQALQAISVAANQAGVQIRSSLIGIAPAARQAGTEITTLGQTMRSFAREQRAEARTVGFFAQQLQEIVPVTGNAKIALEGLGQLLVGGLGIGAAIAVVTTGIRFMADAWREADRVAREALDAGAKRIDAITEKIDKMRAAGKTPAESIVEQIRLIEDQVAIRTQAIPDLERRIPSEWRGLSGLSESQKRLEVIKAELAQLRREADKLRDLLREELKGAVEKIPPTEAQIKATTVGPGPGEGIQNQVVPVSMLTPVGFDPAAIARAAARSQEEYNREVERSAALAQQWGEAIGGALGALMTGQATAGQVAAQIGRMVIQSVIRNAIAQITANAAVSGSEAAKSQAGIPVIGPVLALAAMGATMSAVLGLLAKLPSARGGWWDTGSYEGLAMIHQREMVLPEREAEAVRRGARGMTVNVNAIDAQGVRELLQEELPRVLRTIQRRGGS